MSDTSTYDEYARREHLIGTHFYGDGCDDDHGQRHVNVRLDHFDLLARAVDYFDRNHIAHLDVIAAARRLVDGATQRDNTRPDDDPGNDAWG